MTQVNGYIKNKAGSDTLIKKNGWVIIYNVLLGISWNLCPGFWAGKPLSLQEVEK